jgi:hypothetical protein
MIKKSLFLLLLFFLINVSNAQVIIPKERGSHIETILSKHFFAIRLMPTAQSKPITYVIYHLYYDSTKNYDVITKRDFMSQFSGITESKANPDGKNLFNEYEIDPMVFEYLWKVRYPEYPFGKTPKPGWAGGTFIPSKTQMQMLEPFGINHPADLIFGENLIRFLKAVTDPAWVNRYKAK